MKKYNDNPLAYVGASPIHGKGLFARQDIAYDTWIGTYAGPFTLDDGMHVLWIWSDENDRWEGIHGNNEMRFLNHSKQPNADWWGDELYALRAIEKDEEITFHYGDEWED
ncbi:MAG: SET domain-containing protein-lysine N-methyltransferase [Wenzhouxiangellaceae bacterium]|nr:SET domain-containing protein-lysine N-methyltransferase [Wenzhouxiangellaceae bacterium]